MTSLLTGEDQRSLYWMILRNIGVAPLRLETRNRQRLFRGVDKTPSEGHLRLWLRGGWRRTGNIPGCAVNKHRVWRAQADRATMSVGPPESPDGGSARCPLRI